MGKTIDICGVTHAYDLTPSTSDSNVLVFIHGWLLSRGYWQPIIQQLASSYQCLSYDLRGFGDSQPDGNCTPKLIGSEGQAIAKQLYSSSAFNPAKDTFPATMTVAAAPDYSPSAYANDLITLLQMLNISNAWLIGHSLGGSIALWAADRAPERIKGVICINSGGGIYLKEEFERFRAAGEQLVRLRPRWLCSLPLVDLLMTRLNVARPLARSWGRQRLMDLVMAHPEAALGALLDSTTEDEVHYLPQVVSRLKQPVYFIAGADDTIMEPQYVRHLASFHPLFRFRGENVTEIPDCGHLAMVEQPEIVEAEIRAILANRADVDS